MASACLLGECLPAHRVHTFQPLTKAKFLYFDDARLLLSLLRRCIRRQITVSSCRGVGWDVSIWRGCRSRVSGIPSTRFWRCAGVARLRACEPLKAASPSRVRLSHFAGQHIYSESLPKVAFLDDCTIFWVCNVRFSLTSSSFIVGYAHLPPLICV